MTALSGWYPGQVVRESVVAVAALVTILSSRALIGVCSRQGIRRIADKCGLERCLEWRSQKALPIAANNSDVTLDQFRGYLRILAGLQLPHQLRGRVDPSDIVQKTLLKAHQALGQFRGKSEGELVCWLRQILARTLANSLRDGTRQKRNLALEKSLERELDRSSLRLRDLLQTAEPSPSQQAEHNEQVLELVQALSKLPVSQREALVLRHCQCWSLAAIAQHMDRTPTAVASLLQRGLKQLRAYLRPAE